MKATVDRETGEVYEGFARSVEVSMDTTPRTTLPFLRTPFNYDRDLASVAVGITNTEPSLTQQHFKEETDINTIVERFGITGEIPTNVRVPLEGDFSEGVLDYQSALNAVLQADNAFMQMPADIRARFHNNPAEFLEFVHDEANRDEAVKLGIVVAPAAPPAPIAVRVIADEADPKN